MKLIIDISEGVYKHIDTIQNGSIGAKQIINSVKNGISAYKDIPSAEKKVGHWIERRSRATGHIESVCSECGAEEGYPYNDYCGNCGVKMQVEL